MPQKTIVLCCYSCGMYQVHISKKGKWQCKICNEKQSLQRVYFQGSGKDCRNYVQTLNSLKQYEPQKTIASKEDDEVESSDSEFDHFDESKSKVKSKWAKYLDSSDDTMEDTNNIDVQLNNDQNLTQTYNRNVEQEYSYHCEDDIHGQGNNLQEFNKEVEYTVVKSDTACYNNTSDNEENVSDTNVTETIKVKKSIFEDNDDIDTFLDF